MTPFESLFDRVIVLTGPTASGKSELALQVVEKLASRHDRPGGPGIEIISLDSIAIYRGMDIGSAKPSDSDRARAVHHLIDIVDPDTEFSVAEYLHRAHRCVAEIWERGGRPMFVGGTPMYLKAILKGFHPGPPADPTFRDAVMSDVQTYGVGALRKRLQQVDPLSASRIDPTDVRRMTRALEFAKATGTPMSHSQTHFEVDHHAAEGLVFALQTPRPVLHERIEQRVTRMFENGLVAEALGLKSRFGTLSKTARIGVGYREIFAETESLDCESSSGESCSGESCSGELDVPAIAEQVLFHTRRLARRQETWFRSFSEIRPVPTHDQAAARPVSDVVTEIADAIEHHRMWG